MTEIGALFRVVERLNAVLAVLLVGAGAIWLGLSEPWWSLLIGAALGALNFRAMGWVARRIASGSEASRASYSLLFVGKIGLLMAACYVLVVVVQVEVVPFLAGISTLPLALLGGAWWQLSGRASASAPPAS